MDMKLNPKLLDVVRLMSNGSPLPDIPAGTIVEVLNTAPATVLIEIADDEGVTKGLLVSDALKTEFVSRPTQADEGHVSGAEELFEQGVLLLQNGLIPKAKAAFDEAFRIDPRFAGTLMNLANESASRGAFEAAIFLYQMIMELQPTYRLAVENLAITHINQGVKFARRGVMDKAIAEFNEALLLNPMEATLSLCKSNLVAAYTALGTQLAAIKRYEEGMQFFFLALQLDPSEETARRNLALSLVSVAASKRLATPPMETLKPFMRMGLTLSESLNAYGATLASLGKIMEAKILVRKATEADPNNTLANKNLDLLESREPISELAMGIQPLEPHSSEVAALQ
jgi:tetratricopeptide (TPR) repeat protein